MQLSDIDFIWLKAKTDSKKWMVILHGRGDSPEGFLWLPTLIADPDLSYLLLKAPDKYYTGYSWYDLPPHQEPGILRSRKLLNKVFAEAESQGWESKNAVLFGFSQGCLMTLEWGGRSRRPFRALVGISGYCYDPETLAGDLSDVARESRWLITHGTLDDVLDFKVTESQINFLRSRGLPIEFKSYRKAHTIDEQHELPMLLDFLKKVYS